MFQDAPQNTSGLVNRTEDNLDDYGQLCAEFVSDVRSQLGTLTGEIAQRNKIIQNNDQYVYGDLLRRSLHVETGHDFTPVNWLRRVAEIHRSQTMGDGFTVTSSYHGVDISTAEDDPEATKNLQLLNSKKKAYAEGRNKLFEAIMRDNDAAAMFGRGTEAASVTGFFVLKSFYDEKEGKYRLELVEASEHFYSVWKKDNFRESDFDAFVYQISKQDAVRDYNVPPTVATSPLGQPLAVLSSANTVAWVSTQPMVTMMEVNGKIQGWKTDGKGKLQKCDVGKETPINAVIVGNTVYQVIDDVRYMPKYYVFPNKLVRRRPWGLPDISDSAININLTYIETLSDWRTVSSKVNFPKYKAFGFGLDTQLPKPKARTVEMIGLGEGQDIVPIQNAAAQSSAELDFARQLAELKEAFVRETGISQQLFDMPDEPANSHQTFIAAMKSISDQVEARRQLWAPILRRVFEDALDCLSKWDDNVKELVEGDDDWYIRVSWPPAMRKDDPSFVTMALNQSIAGYQSVQTLFERLGLNAKEEIDRINDEMSNPITAAMHGKLLNLLAESKIMGPPSAAPPKINVNLKGDLTPQQETNLSVMHDFGNGPIYGPSTGPQGNLGQEANDNFVNKGMITGPGFQSAGQPIIQGGQPLGQGNAQPQSPQTLTPPTGNTPGNQVMSTPGSGIATPNSGQGNLNQVAQRRGRK